MANSIILMADIIHSGKYAGDKLMQTFSSLISAIKKKSARKFHSPITITLGDEFQSVVKTVEDAIAVVIQIEEKIIELGIDFKLRYSIYEGEIDTPINKKIAYAMLGSGLTNARENLDSLKRNKNDRLSIYLSDKKYTELVYGYFVLYMNLVDSWNPRDFPLIHELISEKNYREVASILKKEESLIWKRNKSLRIRDYLIIKKLLLTPHE